MVDGGPHQMNTGQYTNAAGNVYSTSKLEYVVSDVMLSGPAGTVQLADVHYVDAGQPGTMSLTVSDVPAGQYTTLSFVHGVPGAENVAGAFPDLDNIGMAWPAMLGGGYHYMRHEGSFTRDDGEPGNFTTHTGPSMGNDFSIAFSMNLGSFEVPSEGSATVELAMDVNRWYTGGADWDFNDYGLIMANTAAQTALRGNGSDVWSIAN
jgi:hypothetical protein